MLKRKNSVMGISHPSRCTQGKEGNREKPKKKKKEYFLGLSYIAWLLKDKEKN